MLEAHGACLIHPLFRKSEKEKERETSLGGCEETGGYFICDRS